MAEIVEAMTLPEDDPFRHFLRLTTGEVVVVVPSEYRVEEDDSAYLVENASEEFAEIPRVETREQYRWMETFAQSVGELDLRERLLAALDGKGAFRRFRNVLGRYGDLEQAWFAHQRQQSESSAREWLRDEHDIEAVSTIPPEPRVSRIEPARDPDRIELLDLLLLGSEKIELLEGRVWKHFRTASKADARRAYESFARDLCAFYGEGWRKRFVEKHVFERGRMRLELRADENLVELSIEMPRKHWDAFGA